MRRLLQRQFRPGTPMRFLLVGGCLAFVYSALAALASATVPLPASVLAVTVWVLFTPVGYWCQKRLTFTGDAARSGGLALYFAAQVFGMLIVALAGAWLATGRFGPDLAVFLGASAVSACVSYLVNRLMIFRPARDAGPPARGCGID